MTTTERPTTTDVPSWLNLDGYCPPEIRDLLADAAIAVEGMLLDGRFEETCRQVWEARRAFETATSGIHAPDDHGTNLGQWSGFSRLDDAVVRMMTLVEIADGEGPSRRDAIAPAWWVPWGTELTEGKVSCAHPAWLYAGDGLVECPICGVIRPNPDDTEEVQS